MKHLTEKDREFLAFLQDTLIPDLKESGKNATAEDFERCIRIIARLTTETEVPAGGMKVTVELSPAQVKGIKEYLEATSHDIDPKIKKADIAREISGIVHGNLQAPGCAVSDYISKYENNGN